MAQRFVRCQLCGLPHPAESRVCSVHQRTIVPAGRALPEPGSEPEPDPESGDSEPTRPLSLMETAPFALTRKTRRAVGLKVSGGVVPTELVGRLIDGRYQVHGVIATGGMGVVYDATQVALGRSVAIKAMHRRLAGDPLALARFQQEAMVLGRFGHPNIVEVYDLGALEHGEAYMVMEKLEGETLTRRLARERPMNLSLAVEVIAQVLSALLCTHARGIIHRDLKPDNVFLAKQEARWPLVKVLDFGISKAMADAPGSMKLTRAGMVMGTPAYMAPEQCRGESNLDPRTDLYALGMILFELSTGRLPFSARSVPALLHEILNTVPPSPRALRPEVPLDLEAFILRALSRTREGRFPDAEAMLRGLKSLGPMRDSGEPCVLAETAPEALPEGFTDTGSQAVQVFARSLRK